VELGRLQQAERNREALFPNSSGNKLVVLVGNMISGVKGHATLIVAAREIVQNLLARNLCWLATDPCDKILRRR
jgi:hypothetical protein